MNMQAVITLSNGIRLVFVGDCDPFTFEDDTRVIIHTPIDPAIHLHKNESIIVNSPRRTYVSTTVDFKLSDWLISDLKDAIDMYRAKKVDVIITQIHNAFVILDYLRETNNTDVPIHMPELFVFEDRIYAKLNSFIRYKTLFI